MGSNPGNCPLSAHPYQGETAVLATMHGKEAAIGPVFAKHFQIQLQIPQQLDTDQLGTFSGEVERTMPALETLRLKVQKAIDLTGIPLGIGTEGSFGPDPLLPFVARHHEIMLWRDEVRGFEWVEQMITNRTNYEQLVIGDSDADLESYLERVQFPAHRLIVMPNQSAERHGQIFKGVSEMAVLLERVAECRRASADGKAQLQTDMRAMMNPTRMAVIGQLAERLATRLRNLCRRCGCPGWGLVDVVRGAPCAWCGRATRQVLDEVYGCPKCEARESVPRADGQRSAPPDICEWCNP